MHGKFLMPVAGWGDRQYANGRYMVGI